MSDNWYCIICGKQLDNNTNICSTDCGVFYRDFTYESSRANGRSKIINGFCNRCGKPLILKRSEKGKILNRHIECYSQNSYLSTNALDKHNKINLDKRFCIICGNRMLNNKKGSICSQVCALIYKKIKDKQIKSINGFCNICGRELILISKDGLVLHRHQECYINYKSIPITQSQCSCDNNIYDKLDIQEPIIYLKNEINQQNDILITFINILINILYDRRSGWYTKQLVNSALSYIILYKPKDQKFVDNRMDELFICSYVLKEIRDTISQELIIDNVERDKTNICNLIHDTYTKSSEFLDDKCNIILTNMGLNYLLMFDFNYLNSSTKLLRRKDRYKLINAMIAIKTNNILNNEKNNIKIKKIKYLLISDTFYDDILKYKYYLCGNSSDVNHIDIVREIFNKNKDSYAPILKYTNNIINTVKDIYIDQRIGWQDKIKINCCLGYIAKHTGYIINCNAEESIDDLYICAYVLYSLNIEYPEIIDEYWGNSDASNILNKILYETSKILSSDAFEILTLSGIKRLEDFLANGYLTLPHDTDDSIERITYEINHMVGLLRTIYVYGGDRRAIRTIGQIYDTFDNNDWEEIKNILLNVNKFESIYDKSLEIKLDEIKLEILLDINEGQ